MLSVRYLFDEMSCNLKCLTLPLLHHIWSVVQQSSKYSYQFWPTLHVLHWTQISFYFALLQFIFYSCRTSLAMQTPLTYTIDMFQKVQHTLKLSVHMVSCMYVLRSPVKSRNPTHWNLIGRSMTALLPVLLPNSICLSPSSHYAFISGRKNSACV